LILTADKRLSSLLIFESNSSFFKGSVMVLWDNKVGISFVRILAVKPPRLAGRFLNEEDVAEQTHIKSGENKTFN